LVRHMSAECVNLLDIVQGSERLQGFELVMQ
jgi:hypothetical protein